MVAVVVMGPSGSGKTTLARHLASRWGWPWVDGDDLHPPANVANMRAGIPLIHCPIAPRGWPRSGSG